MKLPFRFEARVLIMAVLVVLMAGWGDDPVGVDAAEAAALNAGASSQGGPVIQTFPSPGVAGPPFYALFAADLMPSDNGTVGIAFLREPSCIPAGFNLLNQFAGPGAFGCRLTVEGKIWWHDPATDPVPFQIRMWGLGAVPIYFVDEAELAAAAQDGVLTIGELRALPSLVDGVATSFEAVAHNPNQPPGAEEQQKSKAHDMMNARGTITQSGVPFFFHYVEEFDPNRGVHIFTTIRIDIG